MTMIRHGWHMKDACRWRAFVGCRIYTPFSFGHAGLMSTSTTTVREMNEKSPLMLKAPCYEIWTSQSDNRCSECNHHVLQWPNV